MHQVVPLLPENFDHASRVLSKSFQRDPSWAYQFPNEQKRPADVAWLFRHWMPCVHPLGHCYQTDDGKGVAMWVPPGKHAEFTLPLLVKSGLLLGPLRLGPSWVRRSWPIWQDSVKRERDELGGEAHWVLLVIGVAPEAQGKGHGASLLRHILDRADSEATPTYVQTHNPVNIPYYERHGFKLIARREACPGGPECCSLRRGVGG
jgi:ribosomal protein S18 acetylase RimI-like enzyme